MAEETAFGNKISEMVKHNLRPGNKTMRGVYIACAFLVALILSAVSLYTTWIGFNDFLAPKVLVDEPDRSAQRSVNQPARLTFPNPQSQTVQGTEPKSTGTPPDNRSVASQNQSNGSEPGNGLAATANAPGTVSNNGAQRALARYKPEPNTETQMISLGTTIGIQGMMLIMAMLLGRYICRMRPMSQLAMENVGFQDSDSPNISSHFDVDARKATRSFLRFLISQRGRWLVFGVSAWALALWRYTGWPTPFSFAGISEWAGSFYYGTPLTQQVGNVDGWFWSAIALGIFALTRSGHLTFGWNAVVLVFLAFMYLGSMSVSSLFSFDAYYRFLRSEADLKLESDQIVGESAGELVLSTKKLLFDTVENEKKNLLKSAEFVNLRGQLTELNTKAKVYDKEIGDSLQLEQRRRAKEIDEAIGARGEVEAELASTKAELENLQRGSELLKSSKLPKLEKQAEGIEKRIESIRTEIISSELKMNEYKDEMDKQEKGVDGRKVGKGTLWNNANEEFQRLNTYVEGKQAEINSQEKLLEQITDDITKEIEASHGNAGEIASLKNKILFLEQRLRRINIPDQKIDFKSTTGIDVSASRRIDLARSRFERSADVASYQNLVAECDGMINSLRELLPNDGFVGAFLCNPPGLDRRVNDLQRLRQGETLFLNSCDDLRTVRGTDIDTIFNFTRSCIQLSGLTGTAIGGISLKLTQLVSEYSTIGHDLRRSINYLGRWEKFALGAAALAIFIDFLILGVGIVASLIRESPFQKDTVGTAEDLETRLGNALHLHKGSASGAAHRILQMCQPYLEPDEHDHPAIIDMTKVPKGDREIVTAIFSQARSRVKPHPPASYLVHAELYNFLSDVAVNMPRVENDKSESVDDFDEYYDDLDHAPDVFNEYDESNIQYIFEPVDTAAAGRPGSAPSGAHRGAGNHPYTRSRADNRRGQNPGQNGPHGPSKSASSASPEDDNVTVVMPNRPS